MSSFNPLRPWRALGLLALMALCGTAPAQAQNQNQNQNQNQIDSRGWRECAAEGEVCRVDNRTVVRYGADGRWSSRVVAGSVACGNEQFGDPAPEAPKRCYVRDYAGGAGGGTPANGGWTFCSAEGELCRFRGKAEVRFGSGNQFTSRSAYGQVRCDVESFGDPAYGTTKVCEVRGTPQVIGPQKPGGGYDGWTGGNQNDWRYCAAEGATCLVNGSAEVRFGDGRRFATRTVSGDVACEVDSFGDPARGVPKHCEVRASGWLGGGSGNEGSWTRCAGEGERCTFNGQAQVRYGAQGRYAYRNAFNGLACETAAFGADPYRGQPKVCEIRR